MEEPCQCFPSWGDLQFTDIDTDEYYLEGLIQWSPPPDESVVDSYDVWIVPDQVGDWDENHETWSRIGAFCQEKEMGFNGYKL